MEYIAFSFGWSGAVPSRHLVLLKNIGHQLHHFRRRQAARIVLGHLVRNPVPQVPEWTVVPVGLEAGPRVRALGMAGDAHREIDVLAFRRLRRRVDAAQRGLCRDCRLGRRLCLRTRALNDGDGKDKTQDDEPRHRPSPCPPPRAPRPSAPRPPPCTPCGSAFLSYFLGHTVPCSFGTEPIPLYTNFWIRRPSYVSVV